MNTITILQKSRCLAAPLMLALGLAGFADSGFAQSLPPECGDPFHNHFGPWDYRAATAHELRTVENVHFTPGVEDLSGGGTNVKGRMAADVAYTLHVFPNHHRALITMNKLGERHKTTQPPGAKFTVDCYFERAVAFRPDDTVARLLFVKYLEKAGNKSSAKFHLIESTNYAGDNPFSHYNIGLVAFDMGEYTISQEHAEIAAELGYPRKELENKLKEGGHWKSEAAAK